MSAAAVAGLAFAALSTFAHSDASAVTIGFDGAASGDPLVVDGFEFAPARIVSGNCLSGECLAFNTNETTVMTAEGGGSFALNELWFQFIGASSDQFTISSDTETVVLTRDDFGNNDGGQFVSFGSTFADVESITFAMGDSGNLRVDAIDAVGAGGGGIAPIPIPSAIWLGAGALAGVGLISVGRRKRQSAMR